MIRVRLCRNLVNVNCCSESLVYIPAAPGKNEKESDPHLVVTGPEIAGIRRLEVAHLGAAFLLCMAGGRVLVCVFPSMVQQQEHSRDKEDP